MAEQFVDRVQKLLQEQGIKGIEMCKDLQMGRAVYSDWRRGKASPSLQTAMKIAEYLDTSIDYLAFGAERTASRNELSVKEQAIMERVKKLAPAYQDRLLSYADGMLSVMPLPEDE